MQVWHQMQQKIAQISNNDDNNDGREDNSDSN